MKQAIDPNPTINPGKSGHELPEGRRVGQFRVQAGDLVEVKDRRHPRPFVAEVAGFYMLDRTIHVQLRAVPGATGVVPRQSTKARNITRAWRLAGRAKTSQRRK